MKLKIKVGDVTLEHEESNKIKEVEALRSLEICLQMLNTHKRIKSREFVGQNE